MTKSPVAFSSSNKHEMQKDAITFFLTKTGGSVFDKCPVKIYPAQAVIFQQGMPAYTVYLIERGLVKLVRVASNGHRMIIGLRRKHWLAGAPSVLLDKPYSFTGVTLVPSSLRRIPAEVFLDLAKTNKQLSWCLLQMLSQGVYDQVKTIETMSTLSALERLERFLCEIIEEQNQNDSEAPLFSLPLNNQELAQLLTITPEHLCRVLKDMERRGVVKRNKGALTVTDPVSLLMKWSEPL